MTQTPPSWEQIRDAQQPWTPTPPRKPKGWWSVVWRLGVGLFGIVFVISACIAIIRGPQSTTPTTSTTTTTFDTTPRGNVAGELPTTPTFGSSYTVMEQAFLSVTANLNAKYHASDAEALNLGHAICTDLASNGGSLIGEAMGLTGKTNALGQSMSAEDAGYYVGAAHTAFCPST